MQARSRFLTRKSRGRRLAISWQASAEVRLQIANRSLCDFRVRNILQKIRFNVGSTGLIF